VISPIRIAIFVIALSGTVYAHDRNRPDLDGWFMTLQNKTKSPCCDGSDAMRLDDVDWESKDGHYRVRLEGEWVDVPDDAVIERSNLSGQTMVWPFRRDGKLNQIRCFMPGSMT
jgi:hypothetical protein